MKSSVKKVIVAVAIVAVIAVIAVLSSLRGVEDFHEKYEGVDLSRTIEGMEKGGTYAEYLNAHSDANDATEGAQVDLCLRRCFVLKVKRYARQRNDQHHNGPHDAKERHAGSPH